VHEFPKSFDLRDPVIDFAKLAEAMGVRALRVDHPDGWTTPSARCSTTRARS
jgi:thiamine pyrophosphate-dependent acetolactate synthase large subunit-like protein